MNTANPRFWIIGGLLASLLLAALGWTLLISPRMEAAAQTREQAVELDDQATLITSQAHQLQAQAQELPAQIRALARIQDKIPSTVNVPALLRDIQASAKSEDVGIDALTPGQITVFTVEQPSQAPTSTDSSAEPAASPDSTQAAPKPSPTDLGQDKLPKGVGLSYVPVTVQATGDFAQLQRFTTRIEHLQRAFLITGVQLTRGQSAVKGYQNPLTLTLDTRVFLANDRLRDLPDQALQTVRGRS